MKSERMEQALSRIPDVFLAEAMEYRARTNRKGWPRWGAAAACMLLGLGGMLGMYGALDMGRLTQGKGECVAESLPSAAGGAEQNPAVLQANEIAGLPQRVTSYRALLWEDRVSMDYEELLAYFDTALPVEECLPSFSREDPAEGYGVFHSEETGEVYYDYNAISFVNEDQTRSLTVSLGKTMGWPSLDFDLLENRLTFTEINGRYLSVFFYLDEMGRECYYTEFLQDGVGYIILTRNMPAGEVLHLLRGIVKESGPPQEGVSTLTGKITAVDPQAGYIALDLDGGQGYGSVGVFLPEGQAESCSLYVRAAVSYTGEPATIRTIWAQQLEGIEILEEAP